MRNFNSLKNLKLLNVFIIESTWVLTIPCCCLEISPLIRRCVYIVEIVGGVCDSEHLFGFPINSIIN